MYSNHKSPRKVSRRAVLGTAAGAGAVGAAGALGIASLVNNGSGTEDTDQVTNAAANTSAVGMAAGTDSPLVLLMDTRTKSMTLFVDEQEKPFANAQVADIMLKAAGKA